MILHLVNDEKIINRTIDIFQDVFPNNNLFVVFTRHEFKLVRNADNIISYTKFSHLHKKTAFSKVIIHSLNSRKINFVKNHIPTTVPVYWIIWGNDLYNKLLAPNGFEISDMESRYFKKHQKTSLANWYDRLKDNISAKRRELFIEKHINYIVTDTTEVDYDMLTDFFPKFKQIPWKDFFYYPIDVILGKELMGQWTNGQNIQIGNSGSVSNNHEYAMRFIRNLDLANRNIYVPMSYSGFAEYLNAVKETGKQLFGDKFIPMEDFLPLQEYNKLMLSFGVVLYGNWRQEAIGNILISLYFGAKVFLPKRNPVSLWAKKHNLIVFELETINQNEIDSPLTDEDRIHNREILMKLYNSDRMKALIKSTFN